MKLMTQGQIRAETGATAVDVSSALRCVRPVKKEGRWLFYDGEAALRAVEAFYNRRLANATGKVTALRTQIARIKDARRRMEKEEDEP